MTSFTKRPVVFLWDNFGPMHADRVDTVAEKLRAEYDCTGLEMFAQSSEYDWHSEKRDSFEKLTLFSPDQKPGTLAKLRNLIGASRKLRGGYWFLCNYEKPATLLFALYLRLRGERVFTMGCSKFDDLPRNARREWLKSLFLKPYQGAIGSGIRSRDYFRFLGIPAARVVGEYNTISVDRIRRQAEAPPAPEGQPFAARHFTIVARLIPKKNLFTALEAYALYAKRAPAPRPLVLCGNGPLEEALRDRVAKLGIAASVRFTGFVQSTEISRYFASSLALLLVSTEEQFGNVIPEAQAMGLPVIVSDNCGARDLLVRSGVNGFLVEPHNPTGIAAYMELLDRDEALWRRMSLATRETVMLGDVSAFADAVAKLIALDRGAAAQPLTPPPSTAPEEAN